MDTIEKLSEFGIIPLVTIENLPDIPFIGECLINGGIPCIEIAFRNQLAVAGINEFRNLYPEIMVGAGTIVNREQANDAVEAGAQFIISPGLDEEIIDLAIEKGVVSIPGVATPTEVQKALGIGIKNVKLFPAAALGGAGYIKAIGAPFWEVRFMPTGGINSNNVMDYLKEQNVFACGGSWLLPQTDIRGRNSDAVIEIITDAKNKVETSRRQ